MQKRGRTTVGLDKFKDKNREELSMIEVARAILEDHGKRMAFADIVNDVQEYLGKSDEEIRTRLPQFYTDMNTDGEFISMGDNVWALRTWFPYESVDEEVNHPEDEDEDDSSYKKHHKKVNAFLASATGSDDIIDYDNDDPEDEDLDVADDDDTDEYGDEDSEFDEDNTEDDDVLPDGIEGQLSQLDDDEDDDEEN